MLETSVHYMSHLFKIRIEVIFSAVKIRSRSWHHLNIMFSPRDIFNVKLLRNDAYFGATTAWIQVLKHQAWNRKGWRVHSSISMNSSYHRRHLAEGGALETRLTCQRRRWRQQYATHAQCGGIDATSARRTLSFSLNCVQAGYISHLIAPTTNSLIKITPYFIMRWSIDSTLCSQK